jgi:hypothetical protein
MKPNMIRFGSAGRASSEGALGGFVHVRLAGSRVLSAQVLHTGADALNHGLQETAVKMPCELLCW